MSKLRLTFLLAFLLALSVPFLAQAPTDNALTSADIARMVKAGVPESIIVREIQMSRTDLGTSPAALIELRKQGASEAVLGAVLDSRMGRAVARQNPLLRLMFRCNLRRLATTVCPPLRLR